MSIGKRMGNNPSSMAPKAIPANQEFFDLLAGDIFARLYTAFPEPIDIHSDAILHNSELGKQDGFDDDQERLERLYGTATSGCATRGYLRFSEVATQDDESEVYFDAVLTSKGLEALRKTPGSLTRPGQTLGDS